MNFERNEGTEQEAVINWCEFMAFRYPELSMLYHIPNGGKRGKSEAARMKRQGVKAGVPDLCLPVPRSGFHGLYIEMKFGKGRTSEDQDRWINNLKAQGYYCAVCFGADAAIRTICEYMHIKGA